MNGILMKDLMKLLSERHPNKKVFVIGDQHFYHNNIIKYWRGEFSSIDEMHDKIISLHNDVINDEDVVIFLGDFSFDRNKVSELNALLNGINI